MGVETSIHDTKMKIFLDTFSLPLNGAKREINVSILGMRNLLYGEHEKNKNEYICYTFSVKIHLYIHLVVYYVYSYFCTHIVWKKKIPCTVL